MKKTHSAGRFARCLIAMVLLSWILPACPGAEAATIILRSGEKFSTSRAWKEGSTVKFYLHGIVVGVPEDDVDRIVKDTPARPSLPQSGGSLPALKTDTLKPPRDISARSKGFPDRSSGQAHDRTPLAQKHLRRTDAGEPAAIDHLPFEGMRWKMRPAALGRLEKIKTEDLYGGIVQYVWQDKPLCWDEVELDGLTFGFWRDRLYSITMWVYGWPRFQLMRRKVFARYGRIRPSRKDRPKYAWIGKQTDALLEFDRKLNTGIFWLRSRTLDQLAKKLYP